MRYVIPRSPLHNHINVPHSIPIQEYASTLLVGMKINFPTDLYLPRFVLSLSLSLSLLTCPSNHAVYGFIWACITYDDASSSQNPLLPLLSFIDNRGDRNLEGRNKREREEGT